MIKYYEHIQIGHLIITALSVVMSFITYIMITNGFNWTAFSVLIIVGVSLFLFATLKTIIAEEILELSFGLGIIKKRFLLKDIESYQIVKNPWYYGWGIHLTPNGWLYNVSGFHAIKINMKTGKKYLIGTDVPNQFGNAIQTALAKKHSC
jgi:hypothetical protein